MITSRATVATHAVRDFSERPTHSGAPPVTLLARVEREDDEGSSVYFTRPPTAWENFKQRFCCCCSCSNYAPSVGDISVAREEDPRTVHVSIFDPSFVIPPSSSIIIPSNDDEDAITETFEEIRQDPSSLPSQSEDEVGFSSMEKALIHSDSP